MFVVPKDVARSAISRKVRTYYGSELLLVAEVVSPRSGSERTDRVQKVREYAQAGIPTYWIVELDPELRSGAHERAGLTPDRLCGRCDQ